MVLVFLIHVVAWHLSGNFQNIPSTYIALLSASEVSSQYTVLVRSHRNKFRLMLTKSRRAQERGESDLTEIYFQHLPQ